MARKRERTLRVVGACLAALQVAAAAVLTPADALLDVDRYDWERHVAAPDAPDAAEHHGHHFCQAVRSLATARAPSPPPSAAPDVSILLVREPTPASTVAGDAPGLCGSGIPRAPPVRG